MMKSENKVSRQILSCIKKCFGRVCIMLRWIVLSGITGIVLGLLGGAFIICINEVTAVREANPWMIYMMPAAGLLIVAVYKFDKYGTGTNCVLEGIHSGTYVPLRMAPLIIISTIITHTVGGSAGREGAALQLGGSIGGSLGSIMKLDEYDKKIMIMCGMSGAFSALFGTPLTATVFSMEIISVGIMQYAALVPCAIAALVAEKVAVSIGAVSVSFSLPVGLDVSAKGFVLIGVFAVVCAAVSILFCKMLHQTDKAMKKYLPNPWIRVVAGSAAIILLTVVLGTTEYLGTGMDVIVRALNGETVAAAFLLKMVFTSITLGSGFKGGAIIPSLFVGATLGCLFGEIASMAAGPAPAIFAACGMAAIFCGVTNCPITSMLLSLELFGMEYMPYFLIVVAISYMESGYFGLYESQKLMYSKTKLKFINRKAK